MEQYHGQRHGVLWFEERMCGRNMWSNLGARNRHFGSSYIRILKFYIACKENVVLFGKSLHPFLKK